MMAKGTGYTLRGVERGFVTGPKARLVRTLEAPRLLRDVQLPENARVLEIGAGRGTGTLALLNHFSTAHAVVADFDPTMLEQARAGAESRVESFRLADAKALPFADASFDATYAFEAFHHVEGYAAVLGELARVTRAGGLLLATDVLRPDWAPRWTRINPPDGIFGARELSDLMRASGFVIERWRGIPNLWAAIVARRA